MKMLGILTLGIFTMLLSAAGAQANIVEFECRFNTDSDQEVLVEVERPFGGSGMRDARMTVNSDEGFETFNYYVRGRYSRGFNRLRFTGSNFDLEINLWPDQRPRWGRTYRSEFRSWDLDENSNYRNIDCRYTGY